MAKRVDLQKIVSPAGVDVSGDVFGKMCELREEVELSNEKLDKIILVMERLAVAAEAGIGKTEDAIESAEQTREAIDKLIKALEAQNDGTTGRLT